MHHVTAYGIIRIRMDDTAYQISFCRLQRPAYNSISLHINCPDTIISDPLLPQIKILCFSVVYIYGLRRFGYCYIRDATAACERITGISGTINGKSCLCFDEIFFKEMLHELKLITR